MHGGDLGKTHALPGVGEPPPQWCARGSGRQSRARVPGRGREQAPELLVLAPALAPRCPLKEHGGSGHRLAPSPLTLMHPRQGGEFTGWSGVGSLLLCRRPDTQVRGHEGHG